MSYQEARKHLAKRLKDRDFDHEGSLKDIIDQMDDWISEYLDQNPPFRLEYDEETKCIVIAHYREYEVFHIKTP